MLTRETRRGAGLKRDTQERGCQCVREAGRARGRQCGKGAWRAREHQCGKGAGRARERERGGDQVGQGAGAPNRHVHLPQPLAQFQLKLPLFFEVAGVSELSGPVRKGSMPKSRQRAWLVSPPHRVGSYLLCLAYRRYSSYHRERSGSTVGTAC